MGRELAEKYGAGLVESRDDRGILRWHVIHRDTRLTGGADPGRVVYVLEPEGDAVHWPAPPPVGYLGLGPACVLDGPLAGEGHDRGNLGVQTLDPAQTGFGQFDR